MLTMQSYSFAYSRNLHFQHLSQPQLNGGHAALVPSTVGYCSPTRIWHSVSPFRLSTVCPTSFCSISHKPTSVRGAVSKGNGKQESRKGRQKKQKENAWSMDSKNSGRDSKKVPPKDLKKRKNKSGFSKSGTKKGSPSTAIVSAVMPVETEKVLQTQEPVIKPIWDTFASSISGIWKGVGAAFSPITAEMEPISLGESNEYLYDCYTLCKMEALGSPSEGSNSRIRRKINWVVANPLGEQGQGEVTIQDDLIKAEEKIFEPLDQVMDGNRTPSRAEPEKIDMLGVQEKQHLPIYETKVLLSSDVMEEDFIGLEPGLVFFEDGSYSRGPLKLQVGGASDDSNYYISPTYKIEQCLVKGCHKRLRLVHTIAVKEGGSEVQLLRLVLYEEEWMAPSHLDYFSDTGESSLKPISQQKRISPSELVGSWKVFEISATAISEEDLGEATDEKRPSYVYLCMETLKRRSLPEVSVHFSDEDVLDLQDITILWLPGGITAYVDTKEDGVLSIGAGWYSDDGTNLVMERDYGADGRLLEVRCKSEVKRRWSGGDM
eukprot:Gb_22170 [translate_table: standard]